jgi:DNA-binding CsgD family transcriptional regulator
MWNIAANEVVGCRISHPAYTGPPSLRPHFYVITWMRLNMKYPVNAQYDADGQWQSTGIDFSDYARMQTQTHKLAPSRHLETPSWAVNNSELRELLVAFMEERAFSHSAGSQTGTLTERLANAQKKIIGDCENLVKVIDRLCARYVELKRTVPFTPEIAKKAISLARQIESLDTRLRFESKDGGITLVCGIIYRYYRQGLDSVSVGKELGIKPPQCRQTLWRLSKTWEKLHPNRSKPQPTGRHLKARQKHVAIAEKLAAENGGCIPSYQWMHVNGYDSTNIFLRQNPDAFAHLRRAPRASHERPLHKPARIKSLPKKLTAELVAQQERSAHIVAMYQSGAAMRKIAAELRCSLRLVCHALRTAGIEARRNGRKIVETQEAERALALYKTGATAVEIAKALGTKPRSRIDHLRRLLKAVGVDLPRQRLVNAKWNSIQQQEIVALYTAGSTVPAIATRFGYAHRIRPLLKAAGAFQPHRDKVRKQASANQIEQIRNRAFYEQVLGFYKDGMSIIDVAMHFGYRRGCGCNRVRRVLVRAGLYQKQKPRQSGAAVAESFTGVQQ